VDKLFEGLSNLSPRRLEKLLARCKNVKVKRQLVRGGKFDSTYHITVPMKHASPSKEARQNSFGTALQSLRGI
jgi:hypothetical protein